MTATVIVLCGPTCSGKSGWVMRLAETLPIEIVSCDSAQVYRGLDIGTAKPDAVARARVAHHLIDVRDAATSYSAGEFAADASVALDAIVARGRVPVVAGGTMLYLRALVAGIARLPRADLALRATLDAQAAASGWPALHAELAGFDPEAAARIHPHDAQRIQRAFEVFLVTGRPISAWQRAARTAQAGAYRYASWALVPSSRATLHARIEARFRGMLEAGLLDEVRALHRRGDLTREHSAIRAVGYRQLWEHLEGEVALELAVQRAVAATRQLAKRQLTWINGDASLLRLDPDAPLAFDSWRQAVLAALL